MEDDKGGAGISSGVPKSPSLSDPPIPSPPQPQPPPPPVTVPVPAPVPAPEPAPVPAPASDMKPTKEAPGIEKRQMFTVELRRGETTVVSWKKLLRESGTRNGEGSDPATNNPMPDARPVAGVSPGEDELKHTLQPPNCFSAVIEKIERLYMGRESSDDEELDDIPDDDQYDTEDSFIDDTELDEYFQIDKLSTKHSGYFVNRGRLEMVESSSSPNLSSKKRRRKDAENFQSEMNCEHVPNEHLSMGNMKIKAAARNAPLVSKKLTPVKVMTSVGEHHQEGKHLKTKSNASTGIYKKHSPYSAINIPPCAKLPNKDASSLKIESIDFDKSKSLSTKDKSSDATESFDATEQASREKAAASQVEPPQKKLFNENEIEAPAKVRSKDKYETVEYSQLSSSLSTYPPQEVQPLPHRLREGIIRHKGTTLERAIRDLEKIVSLSRPPNPGVQEVDPSAQGVKRRLPQDVKHKLAKVARLSASQSKISGEELIDRLMGFLGHLVQRKTLKRNLREMVQLGISAKQQKADKFLQIKKEVLEMIKARASHLVSKVSDQQHGLTNDFQNVVSADERRALTGRHCMDVALEDKICDLYDLYVEGMDEDKGPQSRKLYVELAELWPAGYMDNLRIKDAIYRAKKRRRHKFQVRDEERIKRMKLSIEVKLEEPSAQLQPGQDSSVVDPAHQFPAPEDKPISIPKPPLFGRMTEPTAYLSDSAPSYAIRSKYHEKAMANGTGMVSDGGSKAHAADVKLRIKRKSESDGEFHAHPLKIMAKPRKEKQNSSRPSDGGNLFLQQQKPSVQMPAANTSHQPS